MPLTFAPSSSVAGAPAPLVDLDASSNPNYPAGSVGDRYRVTVAGKVGGASGKTVEVNEVVECIADNAGGTEASVGTSWIVYQTNIIGLSIASGKTFTVNNTLTLAGASDGYTLTVPATGTAALLGTANVFTVGQSITPAANTVGLTMSGYSLTGSNGQSLIDLSGTWNTTGTPTAIKLNITDTASNAASLLMDLQVNSTGVFAITKGAKISNPSNGYLEFTTANGSTIATVGTNADVQFHVTASQGLGIGYSRGGWDTSGAWVSNGRYFGWTHSEQAGTIATRLYSPSAAVIQAGQDHATTPTAQTLVSHSVTTGTGANMIIGAGTGSVAGGSVILATRATTGALTARLTVAASGVVSIGDTSASHVQHSNGGLVGYYSTSNRVSLNLASGSGSSCMIDVGQITAADALIVRNYTGAANCQFYGGFSSNTSYTFLVSPSPKEYLGAYSGDGHVMRLTGGIASTSATGGAGGSLSLEGGAAAGSGNNDGGAVTITGGAPTGSGARGNVLITNLPTSSAGLPTGALWNDTGTLKIA